MIRGETDDTREARRPFELIGSDHMSKDQGFFVYGMVCHMEGKVYVKLGKSRCISKRISNVQIGCPVPIHLVLKASYKTAKEMDSAERQIHIELDGYRSNGEWFCFDLDEPSDLADFDRASASILPDGQKWEEIKILSPRWKSRYFNLSYEPEPIKPVKLSDVMSLEDYRRSKRGLAPKFWRKHE